MVMVMVRWMVERDKTSDDLSAEVNGNHGGEGKHCQLARCFGGRGGEAIACATAKKCV